MQSRRAPHDLPVPMDGHPARSSLVHPSLELSKNRVCLSAAAVRPDVGLVRVELTTSRLSGVRSNHLSYRPIAEWFPRPAFPALPGKWPLQDPARARRVRCIQ